MRESIVLFLALTACVEQHEAIDPPAEICASASDAGLDLQLSYSCVASSQQDKQYTCEATLDGAEIVVSSLFTYTTEGNSTTLDCGTLQTTCSVELPPDGTYTVIHGDEAWDIEIVDGDVEVPEGSDAACSSG